MWNWLLNIILPWRWFKKKEEPTLAEPVSAEDAATKTAVNANATPARNPEHYRSRAHYREKYYRRGNNFYSVDDDSMIEDLILLTLLMDVFDEQDAEAAEIVEETNTEEDVAAIDAAVEEVRDNYVEPEPYVEPEHYVAPESVRSIPEPLVTYTADPEPTKSYGGGSSSYDGGGSSYDGGGSSYDGGGGGSFD